MLELYGSDSGMHTFAVLLQSWCLWWSLPLQAAERPVTLAFASGSDNMHASLIVATIASASVCYKVCMHEHNSHSMEK